MEKELDILLERYMQGKTIRKLALITLTVISGVVIRCNSSNNLK